MVKDIRSDPIFKGSKTFFKSQEPIKQDLLLKYRETVDQTIAHRILVMAPVGIILHLTFIWFDFHFYPQQAFFFLKIRLIDSALALIACIPAFVQRWKKFCVWSADFSIILLSAALIFMIYKTDGASSGYFAGITLTLTAMLIVNSFYTEHSFFTCLAVILLYILGVRNNETGWNMMRFYTALYFIASTTLLVVMMTKFYQDQHFKAFIRNEELKENERKLEILYGISEEKAKVDDLTKVYNRRYFFEILAEKIKACQLSVSYFYLIIFDIDNFKLINDTYGHVFGDQVISTIAKVVRNMMRLNSYIGRYGGDEFMLIIDKATKEEFFARVQMVSKAIQDLEFYCGEQKVTLSASFGAARFDPDKGMDEKKLVELADNALLEVKRTKRGEIKLAE
ncbi:MAG TPA: GGDEF domain-containing protein [Candidatus Omnitrophota bacterium]|nr:GGDEF domain-containing protein [Candidatus Omnitrophota bacterium]